MSTGLSETNITSLANIHLITIVMLGQLNMSQQKSDGRMSMEF